MEGTPHDGRNDGQLESSQLASRGGIGREEEVVEELHQRHVEPEEEGRGGGGEEGEGGGGEGGGRGRGGGGETEEEAKGGGGGEEEKGEGEGKPAAKVQEAVHDDGHGNIQREGGGLHHGHSDVVDDWGIAAASTTEEYGEVGGGGGGGSKISMDGLSSRDSLLMTEEEQHVPSRPGSRTRAEESREGDESDGEGAAGAPHRHPISYSSRMARDILLGQEEEEEEEEEEKKEEEKKEEEEEEGVEGGKDGEGEADVHGASEGNAGDVGSSRMPYSKSSDGEESSEGNHADALQRAASAHSRPQSQQQARSRSQAPAVFTGKRACIPACTGLEDEIKRDFASGIDTINYRCAADRPHPLRDHGVEIVGRCIATGCSWITTLWLGANEISPIGAKALGEGLSTHEHITDLNLADNPIRSDGLEALCKAMAHCNCPLKRLTITTCQIIRLPIQLVYLYSLEIVVLEDNNILFPQREVLARGTTATIKFLREYDTAKRVWDKGSFGKNSKLGTQNRRRLQPNVDMSEAEAGKTLGVSALSWSHGRGTRKNPRRKSPRAPTFVSAALGTNWHSSIPTMDPVGRAWRKVTKNEVERQEEQSKSTLRYTGVRPPPDTDYYGD